MPFSLLPFSPTRGTLLISARTDGDQINKRNEETTGTCTQSSKIFCRQKIQSLEIAML